MERIPFLIMISAVLFLMGSGQCPLYTYTACPEIIYDAQYDKIYVFFGCWLTCDYGTFFVTQCGRTQDGFTWQNSGGYPGNALNYYVGLSPQDGFSEGTNNSDMASEEFNGNSYFIYLTGDQRTVYTLRTATWFGSLIQYCRSFFAMP